MKMLFAFVGASLLALGSFAEEPVIEKKIGPTIQHGSAEDVWGIGAQWRLSLRQDFNLSRPLSVFYVGRTEGTVVSDKRANSRNLFAEIESGLNYEWTRTASAPAPTPADTSAGVGMGFGSTNVAERAHWGNFNLSGIGRFETDQSFDNYNATYGLGVGYVHRNESILWSFIPNTQVRGQRVEVLFSRDFKNRGISEDSFWRVDVLSDWTFKFGRWIDPEYTAWYGGLGAQAELKYAHGFEMPAGAAAAHLDDWLYYSGGLNYRFKDGSKIAKWLSLIYLTVGQGRVAPAVVDQTQVLLGVVINFD